MDKNRWLRYSLYSALGALLILVIAGTLYPGIPMFGMSGYPGSVTMDRVSLDYWATRSMAGNYLPMTNTMPAMGQMAGMPSVYQQPAYIGALPMTGMAMNTVSMGPMGMAPVMQPMGMMTPMAMPMSVAPAMTMPTGMVQVAAPMSYGVWMR